MKGFVCTPEATVDFMVNRLFERRSPDAETAILDPGCGTGAFVGGIIRWCERRGIPVPRIVGIELDPKHVARTRRNFGAFPTIEIRHQDFLVENPGTFDFVIGNPPYVPITQLSRREKATYRRSYDTAEGRFDLYLLFFEQALRCLKPSGRLVFVTPEKFLYVETAKALRRILAAMRIEEIRLVEEQTFGRLTTYPTITTVCNVRGGDATRVVLRDGVTNLVRLPTGGASWMAAIQGDRDDDVRVTLADACLRVSCGVATGADRVFVRPTAEIGSELVKFARPTIAGRDCGPLNPFLDTRHSMLIPYSEDGELLPENQLGALGVYFSQPPIHARLLKRTCVARKPWYAFHETPPLPFILRPKILCKDITARPHFWIDQTGLLVPRHSLYYIVPRDSVDIEQLCRYLNSPSAEGWLRSHCQHAANGFLRLQSAVLKQLPVPARCLGRDKGRSVAKRAVKRRAGGMRRRVRDPRSRSFGFAR